MFREVCFFPAPPRRLRGEKSVVLLFSMNCISCVDESENPDPVTSGFVLMKRAVEPSVVESSRER